MRPAYYRNSIDGFLKEDDNSILGKLSFENSRFVQQWTVGTLSWNDCIKLLKLSFKKLVEVNENFSNWHLLLEYEIPRLASRIDAVIIANDVILVIEFKMDRKTYEAADIRQAEDYALDLKDFHLESRNKPIIPILFSPLAPDKNQTIIKHSNVSHCLLANQNNLHSIILDAYKVNHSSDLKIDLDTWENSVYKPTPTIVQAAKALFAGQKVEDISNSGADSVNLTLTSDYLINTIQDAKTKNKKVVCFVTGVPGAGKTLVGLNIIHEKEKFDGDEFDTAYFSGNGPLISVLKEALARDNHDKQVIKYISEGKQGNKPTKKESAQSIKGKIQNLHSFIKEGIRNQQAPTEKVVVFDEAQRCWNATHFFNKSKQNQNRETNPFDLQEKSEAELLFEIMDRHKDWSVIIALVGGGQEINTGEGGIAEWGKALKIKYPHWNIHISPQLLLGDTSTANQMLFDTLPKDIVILKEENLHLKVNQRSFKANNFNEWVNAVLNNQPEKAKEVYNTIKKDFPILLTRDLSEAKTWLRSKVIGNKRIGLVASSGAVRLKSDAVNIKDRIEVEHWFLNEAKDIRSSYYLEQAATEFDIQGLEIDFCCLCWDLDLAYDQKWIAQNFNVSNSKWSSNIKDDTQRYLINKYRVLLTRAREGVAIWIPNGDKSDLTRPKKEYDKIYEYLKKCGL
ncbi:DUF2075 domain-containing protein [Cytophaga aurantiaca]|uniref:DUF2075 domain-containing protein n=1 Tax=Cytophaga aurantiaca TaxID=29530 RepID=UPI0003603309|nr:DUF2075 domain-containing protein [Cytophaga aurantiaca]